MIFVDSTLLLLRAKLRRREKRSTADEKVEECIKLTITLVLLINFKMSTSLSNPVNSIPIRESSDQGSGILGERMENQSINTASEELRI